VVHFVFANDEVVWVSWKLTAEERVPSLRHTNDFIGAYVTTGVRIHLYRHLDRLHEKAIYCDTDSFIFIQPRDERRLVATGDNLGDMTSELKPYEIIFEFVSAGPKNYKYTILDTRNAVNQTFCKVRGITLNYNASQLVNFDVIKDMILNREPSHTVTVHTEHKIKRKRNLREGLVSIITEPEDKTYKVSFFKRRRLLDNTSVPFGYI